EDLDVVDAEQIVHSRDELAPLVGQALGVLLRSVARRSPAGIRFDGLLALSVRPRECALIDGLPVLLYETAIRILSRQPRVHFEDLGGFFTRLSGSVQLLVGPTLPVHIAALTILVEREVLFYAGGKGLEVGKGTLLSVRCKGQREGGEKRESRAP